MSQPLQDDILELRVVLLGLLQEGVGQEVGRLRGGEVAEDGLCTGSREREVIVQLHIHLACIGSGLIQHLLCKHGTGPHTIQNEQ